MSVEIASEGSPRFREMTYDVAGRMIREESPDSLGGTLVRTMEYNDRSLLAKQTETGRAATLYEYDALANLIRSGLDINGDDALVLASTDRITDTDRLMELDGAGDWFEVSTTTVYPEANASNTVEVSRTARRMSNFPLATTDGDLVSETISTDVHGQSTTSTAYIDRPAKTMHRITNVPGSTIDAKQTMVNGLLTSQNSTTVAEPTLYGYDAVERRTSVKDPRHAQAAQVTYYTDNTQVFEQINAAGNVTTLSYVEQELNQDDEILIRNGAGQIASITDPKGQKSYFAYDALGRQLRTWGETDYPQEYSYNTYGELETLTTWRDTTIDFSTDTWPSPSGGDTTTWTYDPATGLLERKEYADGNGTDYSYDSANRLSVRTWARDGGLDTTYSYDPATGELLTVNYEDAGTADITYTYDRLGRQLSVTDATGTRTFDYDTATLQLDTETLDSTFYSSMTLSRSYDALGRASGYSLGGTSSVSSATYGYDTTGRLATVTDPANGGNTFTYAYETDSNLLASLTAPQHTVAYTYENNRDLMTIIDNQAPGGSSSVSTYTYGHDELGRRTTRQQSGSAIAQTNTDTFTYNERSEVEGSTNSAETATEWNPAYTYDQIGNRLTAVGKGLSLDPQAPTTYTANELNQYTQVSGLSTQPSHDADGNLTDDGIWTYTWNGENRLIEATDGTTTIDFTYDYQGRLVEKDDGTNVERYVYDGWNRIATFDVSNLPTFTLAKRFLWGLDLSGSMQGAGGVGGLLKETKNEAQGTTNHYPLYDANGNIMQKLDGTGTVVMNVDYDPFGNVIALKDATGNVDPQAEFIGEYGFSTKPLIDGIQMYYYGFRYYDPITGRWPSRDPIGEFGGLNLYGMVGNRPVNNIDILGLICDDLCEQGQKKIVSRDVIVVPAGFDWDADESASIVAEGVGAAQTSITLFTLPGRIDNLWKTSEGLAGDIAGRLAPNLDGEGVINRVYDRIRDLAGRSRGYTLYTVIEYKTCVEERCCFIKKRWNWSDKTYKNPRASQQGNVSKTVFVTPENITSSKIETSFTNHILELFGSNISQ